MYSSRPKCFFELEGRCPISQHHFLRQQLHPGCNPSSSPPGYNWDPVANNFLPDIFFFEKKCGSDCQIVDFDVFLTGRESLSLELGVLASPSPLLAIGMATIRGYPFLGIFLLTTRQPWPPRGACLPPCPPWGLGSVCLLPGGGVTNGIAQRGSPTGPQNA